MHSSVSHNASNRRVEIDGKHEAQGEERSSRENERDRMNHGAKRESAGKGRADSSVAPLLHPVLYLLALHCRIGR